MDKVIRERERRALTGVSRATWRRWEQKGLVPPRIKLGPRVCGWKVSSLESWLESRAKA